jgi:hypothetical protein
MVLIGSIIENLKKSKLIIDLARSVMSNDEMQEFSETDYEYELKLLNRMIENSVVMKQKKTKSPEKKMNKLDMILEE